MAAQNLDDLAAVAENFPLLVAILGSEIRRFVAAVIDLHYIGGAVKHLIIFQICNQIRFEGKINGQIEELNFI